MPYALCAMLHTLCAMRYVLYALYTLRHALCSMRIVLLIFGRFLSPVKEGGMFTPWNSFSACLLAKNDRIGRARLDLVNQGDAIPLGVRPFLKKVSHKAPPTHNEGGAFCFTPWDFLIAPGRRIINRGRDYFTEACPEPCKAYFIWASYLPPLCPFTEIGPCQAGGRSSEVF